MASQTECERCFETYVVIFTYLQMTLPLNKFALPWFILCAKQHE